MANLFEVSDFALFTQYQGKTQEEAPDGQSKLRSIYDKLGYVLDVLRNNGYKVKTEIDGVNGGTITKLGMRSPSGCNNFFEFSTLIRKYESDFLSLL